MGALAFVYWFGLQICGSCRIYTSITLITCLFCGYEQSMVLEKMGNGQFAHPVLDRVFYNALFIAACFR